MMDELESFKDWWLQNRVINTPELNDPLVFFGNMTGIVLYRKPPFQVQLFIGKPNSKVIDHVHQFVDSIEVHLGGDIDFHVDGGETVLMDGHYITRVNPNVLHGASSGKRGCSFLSIQNWGNINPTSITYDWLDTEGGTSGWAFDNNENNN